MSRISKRLLAVAAAIVVYAALLVVLWAARPLTDTVPVGMDWTPTLQQPPATQRLVSQEVECKTMFDSSARDDEPLPTLTPKPEGRAALDYQREPCSAVQRDARILLGLDIVAIAAAGAGLVLLSRRLRRPDSMLAAA